MASKRILLVEDDLIWGDLIAESLRKAGYETTWFCRAYLDGEKGVNLMSPDSKGELVAFKAEDYDVVILDGRLKGSPVDGWDVAPRLVAAGLPVIGMSGAASFNERMVEVGCYTAMLKWDLWAAARDGKLVL